jgi:hypothetical protein
VLPWCCPGGETIGPICTPSLPHTCQSAGGLLARASTSDVNVNYLGLLREYCRRISLESIRYDAAYFKRYRRNFSLVPLDVFVSQNKSDTAKQLGAL